jgi:hypothetical protein
VDVIKFPNVVTSI